MKCMKKQLIRKSKFKLELLSNKRDKNFAQKDKK